MWVTRMEIQVSMPGSYIEKISIRNSCTRHVIRGPDLTESGNHRSKISEHDLCARACTHICQQAKSSGDDHCKDWNTSLICSSQNLRCIPISGNVIDCSCGDIIVCFVLANNQSRYMQLRRTRSSR